MTHQYSWEIGDVLEAENKAEALVKVKEQLRKLMDAISDPSAFENQVTVACID